jgi:DNA repair protein RadC
MNDNTALKQPPPPHHSGHRDRLRERFLRGGVDALQDYEILELILFMALPRRDVKPLAKKLIQNFGSFNKVFHASVSDLVAFGLSETTAISIKTIEAASFHLMKQDVIGQPVLNSWAKLLDYIQATMAHEGTVDHTPAYPREIVKRALELSATAIILVHNHPSGDSTPSKADIDMTQAIIAAARPLGIVIHDHLVVSKNGVTSMKNKGLM